MFQYDTLAEGTLIADSATTIVTNTATDYSTMRTLILFNTSADTSVTVTLHKVLSGDAISTTTPWWEDTIPARMSRQIELPDPGVLLSNTGDMLQAIADVTNLVNIRVDGGIK